MSAPSPQPTIDPAESLARIVEGLCEAIAAQCEKEVQASPLKRLARIPLRRLAAWFAALLADFRAGLLPTEPQARRRVPELRASARLTPVPPPHLLRRGFDWLLRLVPGKAAFGRQMRSWLLAPEIGGVARGAVAVSPPPPQPALPNETFRPGRALSASRVHPPASLAAEPNSGSPIPASSGGADAGEAPPDTSPRPIVLLPKLLARRTDPLADPPGQSSFSGPERHGLSTPLTFRRRNLLSPERRRASSNSRGSAPRQCRHSARRTQPPPRLGRQPVGAFVHRVTGVAANPAPLDLMAGRGVQEPPPQIHVRDRIARRVAPVAADPACRASG